MNCSEDLGSVDMMTMHQMSTSSILSPESVVCSVRTSGGGGGGAGGGALGSAELGRRLLLAARHGDTQLVLDLMAKGAPFTTDWLGTSALHVAAMGAHAQTCAVLLRAGVSRDCRTKVDRTPLHMAAHAGHAEVADLLLQNHAAVDCRDMLHMTPLHWACARGHADVVSVLLRCGADTHALSKFKKMPHVLALENNHHHIVKLIEDALKDREAADSVESLRAANETEASAETQRIIEPLDKPPEPPNQTNKQTPQPEPIKINIQRPLEARGAGGGGAGGEASAAAAAAMLRRHGITLLPHDEGSTVLTALQSGRSVVLSDAGKLMLKESSEIPQVQQVKSEPVGAGVVLTATAVKSPPKPGVKIFTLNNKLLAMPKENKAPVKKVINPHDTMQVQYIKLPTDAKITGAKSIPMKAKNKMSPHRPARAPAIPIGSVSAALACVSSPGGHPAPVGPRPTVKLMMQKANLNKLTDNVMETSPLSSSDVSAPRSDERNVLFVPEEFLTNSSPKYLRTQLLTAHKTIASLNAQLNSYKTRLAKYEHI